MRKRMWGWMFLAGSLLLMLPGKAVAADPNLPRHLGKTFAFLPSLQPVFALREETGGLVRAYSGAELSPTRNVSVRVSGAAFETYRTDPQHGEYGLMDPNSPAMQVQQQAVREKYTGLSGGSGMRIGGSLQKWKPGLNITFYGDRQHYERYEFEQTHDPYGHSQVWVRFKLMN